MKSNTFIKFVNLVALTLLFTVPSYSTVMGLIKIDIIGFDEDSNFIYFTRTDWAECDCPTELYIYKIGEENFSRKLIKNDISSLDWYKMKPIN